MFSLAGFEPAATVSRIIRSTVSFTVQLPTGKPLTQYRTGPGPHTGVHLIIVRDDLAYIIHQHPPIGPNGLLRQTVTFPAPGPYKVLVDVYPKLAGVLPNFQLTQTIHVAGPTTRSRCRLHSPTWSSTATTSPCRHTRAARDPGPVHARQRDRPPGAR